MTMNLPDVHTWLSLCNEKVNDSERISIILQNPDFIHRMRGRLVSVYEDLADFGVIIGHLTFIMFRDGEFRDVVLDETCENFVRGQQYPWFCFWCSIHIFRNIQRLVGHDGSVDNGR